MLISHFHSRDARLRLITDKVGRRKEAPGRSLLREFFAGITRRYVQGLVKYEWHWTPRMSEHSQAKDPHRPKIIISIKYAANTKEGQETIERVASRQLAFVCLCKKTRIREPIRRSFSACQSTQVKAYGSSEQKTRKFVDPLLFEVPIKSTACPWHRQNYHLV